jgi:hypothetical protein
MNSNSMNTPNSMPILRSVIALVVALPLFLLVGWPHSWVVTFLIALVSFGVGRGVEALVLRKRRPEGDECLPS